MRHWDTGKDPAGMGCGMEAKCSPTTRPKLIFEIIFADIDLKSLLSIAAIPANQEKKKKPKNQFPLL